MKISIIIPTYNRRARLLKLLGSIARQADNDRDCEVMVVDDGSKDDTYDQASRWALDHPRFHVVTTNHMGPGRARNYGVARTGGEVVVFIDDDCLAWPGWLSAIRLAFQNDTQLLGLEGRTITEPAKVTPMSHYVTNDGGRYWTCNVAYRRQAFNAVGGFDPDFMIYAEDTDIALKMLKQGRIEYCAEMLVLHPVYPLAIRSAVRKMRFILHSELLLSKKHPEFFRTHREGGTPARYFYYRFFFRHLASNLKAEKRWLLKGPGTYIRYAVRLVSERVYLLLLFDWFLRQRRSIGAL